MEDEVDQLLLSAGCCYYCFILVVDVLSVLLLYFLIVDVVCLSLTEWCGVHRSPCGFH